jgi:hypothetical protein
VAHGRPEQDEFLLVIRDLTGSGERFRHENHAVTRGETGQ